ncbi:Heterokaryon incompatibility protein (HET) domain containing protein [Hyaloscypha variabilis]
MMNIRAGILQAKALLISQTMPVTLSVSRSRLAFPLLKSPKDSIRLLKILPRKEDDARICVSLEIFQHSKVVNAYKALSYTWGAPYGVDQEDHHEYATLDCPIACDGKPFMITKNLLEGLIQLQDRGEQGWLWIDAICINQDDEEEKAVQISMMSAIYADASMVIVWLGVLDDASLKALELFDQRLQHEDKQYQANSGGIPQEADSPQQDYTIFKQADEELLERFFRRRWFRRVWIVQEIALAKEVIALCGSVEVNILLLLEMAYSLTVREVIVIADQGLMAASEYQRRYDIHKERIGASFAATLEDWTRAKFAWDAKQHIRPILAKHRFVKTYIAMSEKQRFGTWLEILLEQLSHREVTHRVDIIFAAVNLLSKIALLSGYDPSTEMKGFEAMDLDYKMPVEHTYLQTVIYLLMITDSLNVFSLIDHYSTVTLHKTSSWPLPSWLPDFTRPLGSSRLLAQDFDATSSLNPGKPISLANFNKTFVKDEESGSLSPGPPRFTLQGILLGSIKIISPPTSTPDAESWCETLHSIPATDWAVTYPHHTSLEVLARTLCAGTDRKQSSHVDPKRRPKYCAALILKLFTEAFHKFVNDEKGRDKDTLAERFWCSMPLTSKLLEGRTELFQEILDKRVLQQVVYKLMMDDLAFKYPNQASELAPLRANFGIASHATEEDLSFAQIRETAAGWYLSLTAPYAKRRLFASSSGHIGLAPAGAEIGDVVAFMQKGRVPFILRPSPENDGYYALMGDAYVDGLMHGEIADLGRTMEDIHLI